MAPPASAFRLLRLVSVLVVVVVVPWGCPGAPISVRTRDEPHSLHCYFNITSNKQPRCMAQCLMGRMDLLLYDCDNDEVKYVNNMLKGTQTLEGMKQRLKGMGDLMRGKLPDLTPEKYTEKDSPTLQVGLMCQCAASGSCSGSLELGVDGQMLLFFDLETEEYKAANPRGELMKETLENDEDVTKYIKVFLKGDCKEWLKFLVDRKKELEATAAPTMSSAPASPPTVSATPARAPGTARSKATTNRPVASVIPVILACFIIHCFFRLL